ncbi:hypothetical protein [Nonomuraea sp. NPDC050783]|uniref:hypothetical protein n=1 Tax=Nonomuraea sp. NPDC050783 TaxID=3154634 RepID=UPI0034660001
MNRRSTRKPALLILTALAAGPRHGHGIVTDALKVSSERVRLRAGTLYAAPDRLQGEQRRSTAGTATATATARPRRGPAAPPALGGAS